MPSTAEAAAADKGRALQIQTKWNYPNPQQMFARAARQMYKPVHALATIGITYTHTHTQKKETRAYKRAYSRTQTHTQTHIDRLLSSHLPRPRWIHYPSPRRRAEFAWLPASGLVHNPHRQQHPRWQCRFHRWGWRLWIYTYFTCGLNTKKERIKYTFAHIHSGDCTHTCAYSGSHTQACRHIRNLE